MADMKGLPLGGSEVDNQIIMFLQKNSYHVMDCVNRFAGGGVKVFILVEQTSVPGSSALDRVLVALHFSLECLQSI